MQLFRVSNFAIVDQGNAVTSAYCNNPVCILKEPESYQQLKSGLHDLCADVEGISKNVISVDKELYHIRFYLGRDWKFLACMCGLDAANSTHACIWCICSKDKCHLEKDLSIVDEELGARTVDGIIKASKFFLQFHFKILSLIHSICFSESVIP